MRGFLLDTNVPSETLRPVPSIDVIRWLRDEVPGERLFVSVVTLGELRRGTTLLLPSAKRAQLEQFIEVAIPLWFGSRVLPVTQPIAERWGIMDGRRQLAGKPLNIADGLIAATAYENDLTLVTRNWKDFTGLDLTLFDPWQPER